jgi:hypothetical protein
MTPPHVVSLIPNTHLDKQPVARPLDLAAALNDEVTVSILIVHGQLDHHLGELAIIQVCQIAEIVANSLDRPIRPDGLQEQQQARAMHSSEQTA